MTVSAGGRSKTYAIAPGVTGYPVTFPVISASDLFVYVGAAATFDPDAPGTALTEGIDYTVVGSAATGAASIVPAAGFPTSGYLTLFRTTSMAQAAAYTPNDGFPAKTHEAQLDRLSLVDQEQGEVLADTRGRAPLAPAGETMGTLPALADRRNRLPVYGDSGDLAAMAPVATGQAVVTLSPAGTPVAMSIEAITGRSTDLTGFDGGFDGLDGSGQTYDGGLDG